MEGGSLIPPQTVAVEQGHQEMLKQSHIKVDNRYFAIDPNLDFEASTILCEDRVYTSDQTPSATQPITFTIQPQFNVFRSLSESRFVFTVQALIPNIPYGLCLIPKPYWSQLFVRDFTANINNVAVNDQHSRTAPYAGFIKILLTQGNIKSTSLNYVQSTVASGANTVSQLYLSSFAGDDTRTLQEGIINIDSFNGEDFLWSYNNIVLSQVGGALSQFGSQTYALSQTYNPGAGTAKLNVGIELTYRPQDGVFRQPKLLPPGVNLNYIFNLNTIGTWCNGYQAVQPTAPLSSLTYSTNPDSVGITFSVLKAQYYERQYTCTQTLLKSYQSLIMRQPLYFSCMTSNTLLYPVGQGIQSVQLTNIFSGRLPNVVTVGLLNMSPNPYAPVSGTGNIYPFKTYSPCPTISDSYVYTGAAPNIISTGDCIQSAQMTVNGRTYPHLWTSNMQPFSQQDLSNWYEQYRQCSLMTALNGRTDGQSNSNLDTKYRFDNPILTKAEFASQCTFLCYNIRRSGTLMNDSGDKEVGGIDLLVNINGTLHPGAQLLIVGLNTDSLMSITDGGSTTSFVF
tara:strand:- start:1328 stop:3025 length:1698 start_codon:yes stop_codon:yes gene_type:complete